MSGRRGDDVTPDVSERAQQRVGTTLHGKWRLDALLGVGGMAAVYSATHRNGSRAAVKVLHVELSLLPDARSRFLREGYVANAVGHEGAVRVIDDDTADDGSLFLVIELLDGETLEDRRQRLGGRMPDDEVLAAAEQVLDVLVAAHAKGIVHRDLKPENLFLTHSGQIKVLDFGIARMRELTSASRATKAGEAMGTPAFMPPEQARGRWDEVDATSDLWACGATMFALLTGRVVHDGATANEALLAAMTQHAPALATVRTDAPGALARVVDRALASDKAQRWPDARAMQDAVRQAYREASGSPITTAPKLVPPGATDAAVAEASVPAATTGDERAVEPDAEVPTPSSARRSTAVIVAGAGIALGVVIAAVVALSAGSGGQTDPSLSAATTAAPPPSTPAASTAVDPPVALAPPPTASDEGATAAPASAASTRRPPRLPATRGATTSAASANCTPPFVIDPATGKKRWKTECL